MVTETSPAVCCWCQAPLKRVDGGPWWCLTDACYRRQGEWAVGTASRGKGAAKGVTGWLYVPTPKQTVYHETRRVAGVGASGRVNRMYGGAAGPGKSHSGRWDQYRKALAIPGFAGAVLRRTMPELRKTHLRAFAKDAPRLGAQFLKSENMLQFENGSLIECGHCEDDDAVSKWLSSEFDQISIDEGSTFEPDMLLELSTRARTSKPAVKAAGGAWFDVLTNPGGRAWPLLRDLFVTQTPDYDLYPGMRGRYDPRQWVYIKALLDDNPYLDPEYAQDLAVLSEARYRQLRWGEEFVTEGAFFSTWRETHEGAPWHVRGWAPLAAVEWVCGMDWGFNSPGVILWVAVLPDGHYHVAHEWKFSQQSAHEIGIGFKQRLREWGIKTVRYVACDPSMKNKTGAGKGESIFETLVRAGLPLRASDHERKLGWARVQEFLREAPDGRPWLTVDENCRYGRRTMPAQVQDKLDPDDLDTNKDDHWADALRYFAMARPSPYRQPKDVEPECPPNSWGWWKRYHQRQAARTGVLR